MPALCPRIRLRLTDRPMPEETRAGRGGDPGPGARATSRRSRSWARRYVCLDTYADDSKARAITRGVAHADEPGRARVRPARGRGCAELIA